MTREARIWIGAGIVTAVGLMQACGASLPKQRPPGQCDETRMMKIAAECSLRRDRECPGMKDADCPVVAECDALKEAECPLE